MYNYLQKQRVPITQYQIWPGLWVNIDFYIIFVYHAFSKTTHCFVSFHSFLLPQTNSWHSCIVCRVRSPPRTQLHICGSETLLGQGTSDTNTWGTNVSLSTTCWGKNKELTFTGHKLRENGTVWDIINSIIWQNLFITGCGPLNLEFTRVCQTAYRKRSFWAIQPSP